jgi:hypothetical protein
MRQIHRPANPCQQMWEAMVATAEQSIAGRRLVGFHAARLTAEEIADIKASGLKGPERRFPVRPSVEARDKREHAVACRCIAPREQSRGSTEPVGPDLFLL